MWHKRRSDYGFNLLYVRHQTGRNFKVIPELYVQLDYTLVICYCAQCSSAGPSNGFEPVSPVQCFLFALLKGWCYYRVWFSLNLISFAPQENSWRSINLMCMTAASQSLWHPRCLRSLLFVAKEIGNMNSFHMPNLCPIAAWHSPQRVGQTSSALPKEPLLTTVQLNRNDVFSKPNPFLSLWPWIFLEHSYSLLAIKNVKTKQNTLIHLVSPSSDLYHAWVAPTLQSDLLVQFWIRSTGILSSDCSDDWKVLNIKLLNPGQTFSFKTSQDHSKWAVSPSETGAGGGWVCVGDINRDEAEEKRGGGTVCHRDPVVWKAYRTAALDCEDCQGKTVQCWESGGARCVNLDMMSHEGEKI